MNIFEDLIEELKEENLLEATVIETGKSNKSQPSSDESPAESKSAAPIQETPHPSILEDSESPEPVFTEPAKVVPPAPVRETSSNNTDFYRRRATGEVSFLQMVEAAFAGVERDQMKTIPQSFDDLEVKKVLHTYLNATQKVGSTEHSQAEFQLLQATEGWYSTLAQRDKRIMTTHLRRYCETSRPPLSAPALIALARFYRNSPYSEPVRSKFDLMISRVFTKDNGDDKRELHFNRQELTAHIQNLYADWSSVPLYATETDDEGIVRTVAQFEDFMKEISQAGKFDELINSNFFNRLRLFKESTNEDFYAPLVTAVGIETNVFIGNRYVELLENEKQAGSGDAVENKYGVGYDHAVSEMTGKTMLLVELLKTKAAPPKPVEPPIAVEPKPLPKESIVESDNEIATEIAKPNSPLKWILIAAVLAAVVIFGAYLATKSEPVKSVEQTSLPKMDLENSLLKQYLSEARINDQTLEAVALPSWNGLNENQKKYALRLMVTFGGENGYRKVNLVNTGGKALATAIDGEVIIIQ